MLCNAMLQCAHLQSSHCLGQGCSSWCVRLSQVRGHTLLKSATQYPIALCQTGNPRGNDKGKLVFLLIPPMFFSYMPVYGMEPGSLCYQNSTPLLVLFMQSVNANAQKHESLSMLIVPFILQDETWILQHLPATSYDELITPPRLVACCNGRKI